MLPRAPPLVRTPRRPRRPLPPWGCPANREPRGQSLALSAPSTSHLPFDLCLLTLTVRSNHRPAAIGIELRLEGFFTNRADQRLVLGGDDHDAAVGHRVTPAIFLFVVADERASRNEHIAIDDGAA